ncbi:MAG TPA: glycosyltransferase family 4 protein [Chitinophagaceae bacterium]|nr:glycosyltransferase family 4 protein [Chitinophagaceae bacterium]
MEPKRILVYYPLNKRSIAIETLCIVASEAGHEVIVLTLTPRGPFHEALEKRSIKTFTHVLPRKSWRYFLKQARYLRKFCRQHKIDVVWSHLQEGNIIAVLARPFLRAKLATFRHHAESAFYAEFGEKFKMQRNRNEVLFDRIINRLSKRIIVPSSGVWYGMEKYEHCNMKKVTLLPYIYDFAAYGKPNEEKVKTLRCQYSSRLLLIMVSRMIASKQHLPVFHIVKKLVDEGLHVKMIVMDDGDLRPRLEQFIATNGLQEHIDLVGFREDFVNYMAASDMLIHPSVTEASNNVVKEMGLLEKTVAVCRNVGDFNDYIKEGLNGYFLDNNNLEQTIEEAIRDAYNNPGKMKSFGQELRKDVLKNFSDSTENRQRVLQLLD